MILSLSTAYTLLCRRAIVYTSLRFRKPLRRKLEDLSMQKRIPLPKYKNTLMNIEPLTNVLIDGKINTFEENYNKKIELYKQYLPPKYNTVLLEALLSAKDINNLLLIIDENLAHMNSFLLAVAIESLTDQVKFNSADPETILFSPEFKKLSSTILYKVRYFETDEILKLWDCLSILSIPGDKLITQCALQMTRYLINDFNTKELRHLNEVLSKYNDDINLVATVKKALPIAYKRLIREKMFIDDHDDVDQLAIDKVEHLNEPKHKIKDE